MCLDVCGKIKDEIIISNIVLSNRKEFTYNDIKKQANEYGIKSQEVISEVLTYLSRVNKLIDNGISYRVRIR